MNLRDEALVVGNLEKLIVRQQRRLAGADIGEDHAADLAARKGRLAKVIAMLTAVGLAGLFENLAVHVIKPAMVNTAQPAVFQPAVGQIGAAMATMRFEHADTPFVVAKNRQLLTHQCYRHRRAVGFQLFRQRHRLPIAAQEFAARRAGVGLS